MGDSESRGEMQPFLDSAQLPLPLHAQLSAGSTKPFGIIQALLRYPGGISDTSTSQLFVPKSLGGTL